MGEMAPFYPSLWWEDLKAILTPGNTAPLPSDVRRIKEDAAAAILKAGGTQADVQATMQQIDDTVAGVGPALTAAGSSLAPGDSVFGSGLPVTLIFAGLFVVLVLKS